MDVLLVEPPRKIWPYINEDDNYLTKQSYLVLAAQLRAAGISVKIVDCMPLRIGWRKLASILASLRPKIVAVGENHALYSHEAYRVFELAKAILPESKTVAGGAHFTHLADAYLGGKEDTVSYPRPPWLKIREPVIDYIVKGEGDITFLELVQAILSGADVSGVAGIAYQKEGQVIHTPPRPLIEDLDSLPMPAYDLVPMHLYGRSKLLFSPGGTTVYHSRGCVSACKFCVWWTQMAKRVRLPDGSEKLLPKWRTKSPEYMVDELTYLYKRFDKKAFVFVDDCFNADPNWSYRFARLVRKAGLKISWFAFMRADYLVRDEELGVLEELVASGLRHVSIGVERVEKDKLEEWNKRGYSPSVSEKAFEILKTKYPQVFRQATFIVGTPDETEESLWRQYEFAKKLDLDYPGFHALTPVPGTQLWNEYLESGLLEARSFEEFDWSTPVLRSRYMSRREIEEVVVEMQSKYVTPSWLLRGVFCPYTYKRRMYHWFVKVSAKVGIEAIELKLGLKKRIIGLRKPKWYER